MKSCFVSLKVSRASWLFNSTNEFDVKSPVKISILFSLLVLLHAVIVNKNGIKYYLTSCDQVENKLTEINVWKKI